MICARPIDFEAGFSLGTTMDDETKPEKAEPRRWNDDNRFKSIRGHIAELIQSGDEARAHLLRKIIVRLDRIEGK